MAIKRGKGQRLIPLDELRADDRIDIEPADPMTAEMIYERRWALTVSGARAQPIEGRIPSRRVTPHCLIR